MAPSNSLSECPPTITRRSEISSPPELFTWKTFFGRLFAAGMTFITAIFLVFTTPVIGLLTLVQRMLRRRKYHTQPESMRVAIIGGGWAGLQCMARLKELGVVHVQGFEREDGPGGTRHPKHRYHSVQIHAGMWITSFSNYEYNSKDQDANDGKASGEETLRYVQQFMKDKGLTNNYRFNSRVEAVKYNSSSRQATLVIRQAGQGGAMPSEEGPFDLVIFAAFSCEARTPDIPGMSDFKGEILNSIDFRKSHLDAFTQRNTKVAVVGGSKGACDMALCLSRSGHRNFQWLFGKPYIFWKYEVMFHDRSFLGVLRSLCTITGVVWGLISGKMAGWIWWGSGVAVTYGQAHNDWTKFQFGILCPKQRSDIAAIPDENKIQGYPRRFLKDGLEMQDGQVVKADCVLFATGNQAGIDKISYEKDGLPYTLDLNAKLFDHLVLPDFPVFCNAMSLFTTFGPKRGVNTAELAIYHLCVRQRLSEEEMKQKAARLFGSSNLNTGIIQRNKFTFRSWLCMHIDLLLAGITDVFDVLYHVVEIFCLGRQSALKFRVLPNEAASSKSKSTANLSAPLLESK